MEDHVKIGIGFESENRYLLPAKNKIPYVYYCITGTVASVFLTGFICFIVVLTKD